MTASAVLGCDTMTNIVFATNEAPPWLCVAVCPSEAPARSGLSPERCARKMPVPACARCVCRRPPAACWAPRRPACRSAAAVSAAFVLEPNDRLMIGRWSAIGPERGVGGVSQYALVVNRSVMLGPLSSHCFELLYGKCSPIGCCMGTCNSLPTEK